MPKIRLLASSLLLLSVGLSNAAYAQDPSKNAAIDALFADLAKPDVPGAAVGVYQGGKLVFAKGYGEADLEQGQAITTDTRFHVASVSKQFTAFAIALLAREGKVDLDAPVRTYLPWVPDFSKTITVRHLILHTSGLRDQWSLFEIGGQDMDGRLRQAQIRSMVEHQTGLNFEPGTEFVYCNTGYTLLGEIVHAVSGKTLREFTSERIFKPLGMEHTFFFDDLTEIVPGRGKLYERDGKDGPFKRAMLNYDNAGATSLFTTVGDLAKWAGNFAHPVVGDRALIEQISHNGTLDDGTAIDYGFALQRSQVNGHTKVSHNGSDAGFRATFNYYPDDDLAVMVTANTLFNLDERAQSVAALYVPALAKAKAGPLPKEKRLSAAQLSEIAGVYLPDDDSSLKLSVEDGHLQRASWGDRQETLYVRADGSIDDGERDGWYVPVREGGKVVALERHDAEDKTSKRLVRAVDPKYSASDLQALTGDYRSVELDITYTVKLKEGALQVASLWSPAPSSLSAVSKDRFETGNWALGTVRVQRDASGRPIALLLDAGRARNVRLDRVSGGH